MRWAALLLSFALLGVNAFYHPHDSDIYWHVGMGRDLVEQGLNPYRDHYSFTEPGARMLLTPVPFQLAAYAAWKIAGETPGFELLTWILTFLPVVLLAWAFRRRGVSSALAVFAIGVATWAMMERGFPRPELLAFPLMLALRALCERAERAGGRIAYVPAILLVWFWVFAHVTSVFGYAALFAFLGGRALEDARKRDFRGIAWHALLLPASAFALGFVNPSWTHPVLFGWETPPVWNLLISEHHRISLLERGTLTYLYWLWSAGAAFAFMRAGRYAELFLQIPLVVLSVTLHKSSPLFMIATLPAYVRVTEEFLGGAAWASMRRSLRLTVAVLAGAALLLGLTLDLRVFTSFGRVEELRAAWFPRDLVENYLSKNPEPSRIFAEHWASGYLIYAMGTRSKIYIDGRTNVLYPPERMIQYTKMRRDFSVLAAEADRWGFERVLAYLNSAQLQVDLFEAAVLTGRFSIEYQEGAFVLLRRGETRFRESTKLLVLPDCWEAIDHEALRMEFGAARGFLPRSSELGYFLSYMNDYLAARDRGRFRAEGPLPIASDRSLRVAARIASLAGDPRSALRALSSMSSHQLRDHLLSASLHLRIGNVRQADETLAYLVGAERDIDSVFRLQMEDLARSVKADLPLWRKAYPKELDASERAEAVRVRAEKLRSIRALCEGTLKERS